MACRRASCVTASARRLGATKTVDFWPGFPETPRTLEVLALAKKYAGIHPPTERDLLLAIVDEGDSIPIRVLNEMGGNITTLRWTAANWSSPLRPQAPEVPIAGDANLNDEQRHVLQLMFRDYGQVQIVRVLEDGHSGACVLLVRPVRVDGYKDAPVVVKLDDRYSILYERRRYDLYVKGTLPTTTARLVDAPIVPDNSSIGGLKYTFVGRLDDIEPVSFREFAAHHDPKELSGLIRSLFDTFGPAWWLQRGPYRFGVWREYEHVLPSALVIEALPESSAKSAAHLLSPLGAWSRTNQILPGEIVSLTGFAVHKLNPDKQVLQLSAGAQPEAVNRSGKVEVRGVDFSKRTFYRGETIDQIVGRVVRTRDDLLLRQIQDLEPNFDPRGERLPSMYKKMNDLPNPLLHISRLLDRQVSGYLSTIHGDFHLGNILVGPRGDGWLIDFAWTREGHTLFDWAMLEASLLIEVVSRLSSPGWEGAWNTVGLLYAINRGDDQVFNEPHPAARALTAVSTIRDIVRQCLGVPNRWDEYYIALAMIALRMVDWQSESIDARRLAFLISALSISEARTSMSSGNEMTWTDITTDMDQTEMRMDDQ